MSDYMRKIFYLRKVEQGVPVPGAGFVRLERRKEYLHLLLCVTEGSIPEGTPVCGIYDKEGSWPRLEFGVLPERAGRYETKLRVTSLPDRTACEKIAGVFIGTSETYWVGGEPDLKPTGREPDEPEQPVEEKQEEGPDTQLQAAEMYPFEDDEMTWCRQIEPSDFSSLPVACWRLGSNSFVLQGYYNYRHLIYTCDGRRQYIGVPGQYHRREQYLARRFGFPRFKGTKRKRITMGDFGYWLLEIGGAGDDAG